MIRLANVLIADENLTDGQALQTRLSANGYHADLVAPAAALAAAEAEHPDLILLRCIDDATGAIALAGQLKSRNAVSDIPVLLLTSGISPALCQQALEAGLDDVIAFPVEDVELFARMRPLVRLAVMHSELRHRADAAGRFGIQARARTDGPAADSRPAVLVIGQDKDGAAAILNDSCEVVSCESLYEAEDLLTKRNFDAALLPAGDNIEEVLGFCAQARNNPRLFNLPMVLLADASISPSDAYRRGATRVLLRPADPRVIGSAVLTLVRRQQLRWSIRGALFDSLKEATRDPLTGLYSRAFLDSYLAERLSVAHAQGRHLSVVFFYIPNVESVRRQFSDDAALHLTEQLGQWITGLLRAEDLTALYQKNEFCVVLPDTPLVEAEMVMHRIAGILAYTDFAVRDVYQPVKVWVQVGSTDAQPNDDMAGLIARARRNLD